MRGHVPPGGKLHPAECRVLQASGGTMTFITFLMNTKFNFNGWSVTPESMVRCAPRCIGGNGLVYVNCEDGTCKYDHPPLHEGVACMAEIQHQNQYAHSKIVDTDYDPETETLYAIHQTRDKQLMADIHRGELMYVSPSICPTAGATRTMLVGHMKYEVVDDWRFQHVAFVSDPAYGDDVATISGTMDDMPRVPKAARPAPKAASIAADDVLALQNIMIRHTDEILNRILKRHGIKVKKVSLPTQITLPEAKLGADPSFNEDEHPRDPATGEFVEKGGGGGVSDGKVSDAPPIDLGGGGDDSALRKTRQDHLDWLERRKRQERGEIDGEAAPEPEPEPEPEADARRAYRKGGVTGETLRDMLGGAKAGKDAERIVTTLHRARKEWDRVPEDFDGLKYDEWEKMLFDNVDTVLDMELERREGSWNPEWAEDRALAYGMVADDLEKYAEHRSTKLEVAREEGLAEGYTLNHGWDLVMRDLHKNRSSVVTSIMGKLTKKLFTGGSEPAQPELVSIDDGKGGRAIYTPMGTRVHPEGTEYNDVFDSTTYDLEGKATKAAIRLGRKEVADAFDALVAEQARVVTESGLVPFISSLQAAAGSGGTWGMFTRAFHDRESRSKDWPDRRIWVNTSMTINNAVRWLKRQAKAEDRKYVPNARETLAAATLMQSAVTAHESAHAIFHFLPQTTKEAMYQRLRDLPPIDAYHASYIDSLKSMVDGNRTFRRIKEDRDTGEGKVKTIKVSESFDDSIQLPGENLVGHYAVLNELHSIVHEVRRYGVDRYYSDAGPAHTQYWGYREGVRERTGEQRRITSAERAEMKKAFYRAEAVFKEMTAATGLMEGLQRGEPGSAAPAPKAKKSKARPKKQRFKGVLLGSRAARGSVRTERYLGMDGLSRDTPGGAIARTVTRVDAEGHVLSRVYPLNG